METAKSNDGSNIFDCKYFIDCRTRITQIKNESDYYTICLDGQTEFLKISYNNGEQYYTVG